MRGTGGDKLDATLRANGANGRGGRGRNERREVQRMILCLAFHLEPMEGGSSSVRRPSSRVARVERLTPSPSN